MPIKNILVHVDADERAAGTVRTAASLARKFNARLSGFFVLPDFSAAAAASGGATMSPGIVDDLHAESEKHAETAERVFREAAGDLAQSGRWICADGVGIGPRAAAANASFYTDLVVMRQLNDEDARRSGALPQDIVVDAGRPLLLLPADAPEALAADNVVVAWSESREAARAVFDALPILEAARTVSVVTVAKGDHDDPGPAEKVSALLGDHGITAKVQMVPSDGGSDTGKVLFDYARTAGADLLVAGAYSHSRLREGLIGGVTNSIFDAAPVPVLLSH